MVARKGTDGLTARGRAMQRLLTRWERSGLTLAEFARRAGLRAEDVLTFLGRKLHTCASLPRVGNSAAPSAFGEGSHRSPQWRYGDENGDASNLSAATT
jgi:hypothetical protein